MRRVVLESPFAGDVEPNKNFARRCVKDSILRGEAPIASHLLFTQPGILDDLIPEQRRMGIDAGHAWIASGVAHAVVVYCDRGLSPGMLAGARLAFERGVLVDARFLECGSQRRVRNLDELTAFATSGV